MVLHFSCFENLFILTASILIFMYFLVFITSLFFLFYFLIWWCFSLTISFSIFLKNSSAFSNVDSSSLCMRSIRSLLVYNNPSHARTHSPNHSSILPVFVCVFFFCLLILFHLYSLAHSRHMRVTAGLGGSPHVGWREVARSIRGGFLIR